MIGYSKCGDIIIIVEFNFGTNDYQRYRIYEQCEPYEPFTVNGLIKDMYKITDPTKKYFKLGSKKINIELMK